MDLGGAIIGGLAGIGSSLITGEQNENAASDARNFSATQAGIHRTWQQQMYRRRYQDTIQDMKYAGLNPILAASQGVSVGNVPSGSVGQSFKAEYPPINLAGSAKDLADTFKKQEETETEKNKQELIKNQAKAEIQRAAQLRSSAGLMTKEEQLTQQKVFNAEQEFEKLKREIDLTQGYVNLNEMEQRRMDMVIKTLQNHLEKLVQMGDVYRGPAGKWIAYLNSIFGQVNIGGAATATTNLRR